MTGSNSDLTIQVCIPLRQDDKELVNVDTMGSVVLPGRIFSDIVRKLPGDQVEWDVDERWKTTLHSDQAHFELKGLDPEEYPRVPRFDEEQMFSLPAELLKSMIRQTGFAVSTSEARGVSDRGAVATGVGPAHLCRYGQHSPVPKGSRCGSSRGTHLGKCGDSRKKPVGIRKDLGEIRRDGWM